MLNTHTDLHIVHGDAVTVLLSPRAQPGERQLRINFVRGAAHVPAFVENALPLVGRAARVIHPRTGVEYELKVVHVTRKGKMEKDGIMLAREYREKANAVFRDSRGVYKHVRKAIVAYNQALACLREYGKEKLIMDEKDEEMMKEMEIGCRNNLAICYFKVDNFIACVTMCEIVLRLQPDNKKALYRRGLAMGRLDWGVRGLSDLCRVRQLEIENGQTTLEAKIQQWERECINGLQKRRKQFAEVYNVMLESSVFQQPIP